MQALGCSCSQDEISPGQCKGITCSSTSLPAAPTASHGSIFTCCHQGCLEARQVLPQPCLSSVGKAAASSEQLPVLCSHSSVWAARGDTHHKMESGVYHFTVKSVRYWIYMVSAEHIRRSSASSCLFETAIIIQAVTLSHRCF